MEYGNDSIVIQLLGATLGTTCYILFIRHYLRRITTFVLCSQSPLNLHPFCLTRFQIEGWLELIRTHHLLVFSIDPTVPVFVVYYVNVSGSLMNAIHINFTISKIKQLSLTLTALHFCNAAQTKRKTSNSKRPFIYSVLSVLGTETRK